MACFFISLLPLTNNLKCLLSSFSHTSHYLFSLLSHSHEWIHDWRSNVYWTESSEERLRVSSSVDYTSTRWDWMSVLFLKSGTSPCSNPLLLPLYLSHLNPSHRLHLNPFCPTPFHSLLLLLSSLLLLFSPPLQFHSPLKLSICLSVLSYFVRDCCSHNL